jgi:hypothetical protein
MQGQLAGGLPGRHRRVGGEVGQLQPHILLDEGLHFGSALQIGQRGGYHAAGGFRVAQPGRHGRHAAQIGIVRRQQRFHRPALRMAAHHDIGHFQGGAGIFHHRRNAPEHLAIGRHHIADIAADEEFARLRLGDQFRHHAAIGAGDEQGLRMLAACQSFEEFLLLGKSLLAERFNARSETGDAALAWGGARKPGMLHDHPRL